MIVPVILSGGSGTRLWPLSRKIHPKQLLDFLGDGSLLQNTVKRSRKLKGIDAPLIICNECYRFMVAEQLRQIDVNEGTIFLEPEGRNSGPAVAVAAFHLAQDGDDPLMLVMPSDHNFRDDAAFADAVKNAVPFAEEGSLVTFGIRPVSPETGYGYIKTGTSLEQGTGYRVSSFVEKPDIETAKGYLESGDYLWNGGFFLFRSSAYLDALKRFEPEVYEACRKAVKEARVDLDFVRLHEEYFASSPSISIDYGVMERADNLVVVPLEGGWSDIGSWDSLKDQLPCDETGNAFVGDVVTSCVSNSYIHSSGRLVGVVGMDNVVVVETSDAVLVADRDRVQEVRDLVSKLEEQGREEVHTHKRVSRPWGAYECIDCGERFQVKRITVKPGGVLSLQKHHHRAEHWVVVSGTAQINIGDREMLLQEDQSTYIPIGEMHRLTNPGRIDLELIEVQTGSYLGEDDILRFEDVYGRSGDKPFS